MNTILGSISSQNAGRLQVKAGLASRLEHKVKAAKAVSLPKQARAEPVFDSTNQEKKAAAIEKLTEEQCKSFPIYLKKLD